MAEIGFHTTPQQVKLKDIMPWWIQYIPHRSMSGFSQMPCVKNCSLMSSILQRNRIPADTRLPAGTKCTSGTVHIDNIINWKEKKKERSELDIYLLFYELQMFIIRSRCCTTCFVGPRSKKYLYSATCRHVIKSISTFKLMCVCSGGFCEILSGVSSLNSEYSFHSIYTREFAIYFQTDYGLQFQLNLN